jgi:peptidoglycan/LPS O-acetylase OafA/YrhL
MTTATKVTRATKDNPTRQADGGPELSIGRIPALDGVRAIGIILVLSFHGGFGWAAGGFFGVDVFFVLSGFLITGLLVSEFRQNSHIGLRRFWGHRVRRLVPALLAMLVAVAVYALFFAPPDTLGQLRSDAVATVLYGNNWHLVNGSTGYFADISTPRPLLHTWSLSIEEQFYLAWPLVVLAILHWTRSLRVLLTITVVGALASAAEMAYLFHGGSGLNRVYYGTDTRALALLIGAALAVVVAQPLARRGSSGPSRLDGHADQTPSTSSLVRSFRLSPLARFGLVAVGGVGLAVVPWMAVTDNSATTWIYYGGFGVIALATAAVLACVTLVPDSPWARALSLRPVRYIGAISYGLYLWHWPIFVVVNNARTGLVGWPLFGLRVGTSLAAAAASFHYLEMPIRRGALRGWRGWAATPLAVGATVVAVLIATSAPAAVAVAGASSTGISPGQHQQLAARDAFTTDPVRFMLFGDSVAVTLAVGLLPEAKPTWGVNLIGYATLGCDLDPQLMIRVSGHVNLATQGCAGWETAMPKFLSQHRPEVVGILLGRWETVDHLYRGTWTHVGERLWDSHLESELEQAISIVTDSGAKVMLFTTPYFDPPEAPDGTTYPENQPSRADAYNALLRTVAERHPGAVTVYDLNGALDPQRRFMSTVDGITVRWSDGIHITRDAGMWLRPKIFPFVDSLALGTPPG